MTSALPEFKATSGKLSISGDPLQLKGASWFGAEGVGRVPDGLWTRNATFYISFLARNGFNALRLPFALDNIASDKGPDVGMISAEPSWHNLSYLDVLERVIEIAAQFGLLVLFDLQRLRSTEWPDKGLWYAPGITLDTVKQTWGVIIGRFCNHWNVLGADLLNEPHGAQWSDWARAASELGNFVLSGCPRWLIFVEGVAHEGLKSKVGEYFCARPASFELLSG